MYRLFVLRSIGIPYRISQKSMGENDVEVKLLKKKNILMVRGIDCLIECYFIQLRYAYLLQHKP